MPFNPHTITNARRDARRAMRAYLNPHRTHAESLTALLSDLMHYADANGLSFAGAMRTAAQHHQMDLSDAAKHGPERAE